MQTIAPRNIFAPRPDIDMVGVASHRVMPATVLPEQYEASLRRYRTLKQVRDNRLPIEIDGEEELTVALQEATVDVKKLALRKATHEFSHGEYMIWDHSVLKWRDYLKLPIFAVFSPGQSTFGLKCRMHRQLILENVHRQAVEAEPTVVMPTPVKECYRDILQMVRERSIELMATLGGRVLEIETSLTAKFSGLIPDEVKVEMRKAQRSKLFESIFIVAEVKEWKWDTVVTSRQGDPLVIGWNGIECWLIKAFDTTSMERLVAEKFARSADESVVDSASLN